MIVRSQFEETTLIHRTSQNTTPERSMMSQRIYVILLACEYCAI